MKKDKYNVLGVMSGTSLDGVDLVYVSFAKNLQWQWKIIHADTVPYNEKWMKLLFEITSMDINDTSMVDKEYTEYLGGIILNFIEKNDIKELDFVSSHGHTALHQPEKSLTYQIGNLPILAKLTNHTVVCDFRKQDVELGGQGAPLVPIGDQLLFGGYKYCLNLGGFANISFQKDNARVAYDVCPVNIVLNFFARKLSRDYDENGEIAKSGNLNSQLLDKLNDLEYYSLTYPKSLGYEWVREYVFPIINSMNLTPADILRTFVEHVSQQIGKNLGGNNSEKILVTGGGSYNEFLIERIKHYTTPQIVLPSSNLIEYKEALIFSLLGVLRVREEINCLKSVTGAKFDHCSGIIHRPKNYSY